MSSPAPQVTRTAVRRTALLRWLDHSAATAMFVLGAAFFVAVVLHALDPGALPWLAAAMVAVPLVYLSEAGALRRVPARVASSSQRG